HAREILLAASAFGASIDARAERLTATERDALTAAQARIAQRLEHYGEALIASGNVLYRTSPPPDGESDLRAAIVSSGESVGVQRQLDDLAAAVNSLLAAPQPD